MQGGVSGIGGASGNGGAGASGIGGAGGSSVIDCFPSGGDNPCAACAKRECCVELLNCATDIACSGADGNGEMTCIQDCVISIFIDGGVADGATLSFCTFRCARGRTIAPATNDLVACLNSGVRVDGGTGTDCFVECFADF